MSIPSLPTLLDRFDHATHAARVSELIALSRTNAGESTVEKLLDQLAEVSGYHAWLVAIAARATHDQARLAKLAGHRDPRARTVAVNGLPLSHDTESFVDYYLASSLKERRGLRRRITREKRTDFAEALVNTDLADVERAALLAVASSTTASRLLPDLADLVGNVRILATKHPDVVLDYLAERVTETTQPVQDKAWQWAGPALPTLADADLDRLLELLENHGPSEVIPESLRRRLGSLIARSPERIAVLLIQPQMKLQVNGGFADAAHRLPRSSWGAIARRLRDDEYQLAAFLKALPPSRRAEIFAEAFAGIDFGRRVWSSHLLEVLPHGLRHSEAKRIVALPDVESNAELLLSCAGFLPPENAAALAQPRLQARRPEERALARGAMMLSVLRLREPSLAADALSRLDEVRNEQDPVRLALVEALRKASPNLLMHSLAPVTRFAQSIVDARDTSHATLYQMQQTAWGILSEALNAGVGVKEATELVDLLSEPDRMTVVHLRGGLRKGGERLLFDALAPRLATAAKRREYRLTFALAEAFGRRGWSLDELQKLIESALEAPSDYILRQASALWLADPTYKAERVEKIITKDPTTVMIPSVQKAICTVRQDLLDVLWNKPLIGRFWKDKKVRLIPLLEGPFTRWLPRQVESYATLLHKLIASSVPNEWQKLSAIRLLGRLPVIGFSQLGKYLKSSSSSRRQAAISALAWTDRPDDGLERLLDIRSDDDVKVAMYTASRVVQFVPPAEATRRLEDVLGDPSSKVTARKEAVRLIGLLREPTALDKLIDVGSDPQTHQDVRYAVGRVVRAYLDDERAWALLEDIASGERDAVLSLAETTPEMLPVRYRERFGKVIAQAANSGEPELVSALGIWGPWYPQTVPRMIQMVTDLDCYSWRQAAMAFGQLVRHGIGWDEICQLVHDLAEKSVRQTEPNAEADADLPHRQRLIALTEQLWLPVPERAAQTEHIDAVADVLRAYPDALILAVSTRLRATDWVSDDMADRVVQAVGMVDDPARAYEVSKMVSQAVEEISISDSLLNALEDIADALMVHDGVQYGNAALALVEYGGEQTGWTAPWRQRLRLLRTYPAPAVVAAARDVTTVFA